MHLIVGLGNPGKEYENSRHNLGFMVADELGKKYQIGISKSKCVSLFGQGEVEGRKVIIAKPQTFMNDSGEAVRQLLNWFKIDVRNLILIYDDLDLEVGRLRLRPGGSAGGHKGVQSVIDCVKTPDFTRMRIGIGRGKLEDSIEYVLGSITPSQRPVLDQSILDAAEAVGEVIKSGLEVSMNKFNPPAQK